MLKQKNILAAVLFSYFTPANKTTQVLNTTSSIQHSCVTQAESSQECMMYFSTVSSSVKTPAASDQYPWLCKSSTKNQPWALSYRVEQCCSDILPVSVAEAWPTELAPHSYAIRVTTVCLGVHGFLATLVTGGSLEQRKKTRHLRWCFS